MKIKFDGKKGRGATSENARARDGGEKRKWSDGCGGNAGQPSAQRYEKEKLQSRRQEMDYFENL